MPDIMVITANVGSNTKVKGIINTTNKNLLIVFIIYLYPLA